MDVYAQQVWVTKIKTSATGKTSQKSYGDICDLFTASETLMMDRGPEFDNDKLKAECIRQGTKLQICPAYSPWVNSLLEGTNSILLNRLKIMCPLILERMNMQRWTSLATGQTTSKRLCAALIIRSYQA